MASFKRGHFLFWIATVFFALSGFLLYFLYTLFYVPFLPGEGSTSFTVYPGDTLRTVTKKLHQNRITEHPHIVFWITRFIMPSIQSGEYALTKTLSLAELLSHISLGKGKVCHAVRLREGAVFSEIIQTLCDHPILQHTLEKATPAALTRALGIPGTSLEGWFLPDTYYFYWGDSDRTILNMAHTALVTFLSESWVAQNLPQNYSTPYQMLIMASILEKESASYHEKRLIAGVLLKRKQLGMRLQADPTGFYVMQTQTVLCAPLLTAQSLLEKSQGYNTYRIAGFPPTPICLPSRASIEAALHPIFSDYLYYRANAQSKTLFSHTYKEHQHIVEDSQSESVSESDKVNMLASDNKQHQKIPSPQIRADNKPDHLKQSEPRKGIALEQVNVEKNGSHPKKTAT